MENVNHGFDAVCGHMQIMIALVNATVTKTKGQLNFLSNH